MSSHAGEFVDLINQRVATLPTAMWAFYGEPFSTPIGLGYRGSPWFLDVLDAVAHDPTTITVRTVLGANLTVWDPQECHVGDAGFTIGRASRLRWHYTDRISSPDPITVTYSQQNGSLHVETTEPGGRVFAPDPARPAFEAFGASRPRTRYANVYRSDSAFVVASVGWASNGVIENGLFQVVPREHARAELGAAAKRAIEGSGPLFDPTFEIGYQAQAAVKAALGVPARSQLHRMPEALFLSRCVDTWAVQTTFTVGRRKPRHRPPVELPVGTPTDKELGDAIHDELERAAGQRESTS